MHKKFLEIETTYDGRLLRSHWIYERTGLIGDAIVSFIGPCEVHLEQMVDLEDVARKAPIYSSLMLHFIVEHFGGDLKHMILYQRLLIVCLQEELMCEGGLAGLRRRGDDLYLEGNKLTVSIATSSPISHLIHTGINIISEGTPVPTKGLRDLGLNPQAFAVSVMNRFLDECEGINRARAKVRPVI